MPPGSACIIKNIISYAGQKEKKIIPLPSEEQRCFYHDQPFVFHSMGVYLIKLKQFPVFGSLDKLLAACIVLKWVVHFFPVLLSNQKKHITFLYSKWVKYIFLFLIRLLF